MALEKLSGITPTTLNRIKFENSCQSDEMDRIRRIGASASCAITSLNSPNPAAGLNRFSSPLATPTDFKVADRIAEAAANTNITPKQPKNNSEAIPPLLEENDKMLRDLTLPLSPKLNALFPAEEPEVDKRNFLIQVNQLVAEMMQLLSKLSDRDRGKTDLMKNQFDRLNHLAGDAIRARGEWGLNSALFGLGATLVCSLIASPGVAQAAGGVAQSLGGLYATQQEAKAAVFSNKISLINTEMQNIATRGSDNSGWKNELLQALNEVKEWMRASVRTNG